MALTGTKIQAVKPTDKAYRLIDGAGMFLPIHPSGSRYWRPRHRTLGREKTLALGVYPEASLSEARTKWDRAQKLISEGVGPCEQKRAKKVAPDLQLSFKHIARHQHVNNKQWVQSRSDRVLKSLETHTFPFTGNRNITTLSTPDLLIPVRATEVKQVYKIVNHLQQGVSAVMRYVVQSGIVRYNPALDMAGALTTIKCRHRPALDLPRLPELLSRIDGYKGQSITRLTVMPDLLVFIRSSELRYARRFEIDIDDTMWIILAERESPSDVKFSYRGFKMRTPHPMPLSQQAVAILAELQTWADENGLIFTGAHDPRKPINENIVSEALRVMGYDTAKEVCDHGFRAMACNALIESGLWSRDAVGRQMSHQERNGVRAACTHEAEYLEEHRLVLQWRADFLGTNRGECTSPFEYAKVNDPLRRWLSAIYTHALPLKGGSTRLNQLLFYAGGIISRAEVLAQQLSVLPQNRIHCVIVGNVSPG